ncbi:hypothetical protein BKA70DRAFT_1232342 [Coprinopsis sp. MPI-PUGE-AT-0042]|nr:hypothetical protein BKA70DRAFT_1232342 [Coprinopsis sp. MPI-PUGE-AT-0042]
MLNVFKLERSDYDSGSSGGSWCPEYDPSIRPRVLSAEYARSLREAIIMNKDLHVTGIRVFAIIGGYCAEGSAHRDCFKAWISNFQRLCPECDTGSIMYDLTGEGILESHNAVFIASNLNEAEMEKADNADVIKKAQEVMGTTTGPGWYIVSDFYHWV